MKELRGCKRAWDKDIEKDLFPTPGHQRRPEGTRRIEKSKACAEEVGCGEGGRQRRGTPVEPRRLVIDRPEVGSD